MKKNNFQDFYANICMLEVPLLSLIKWQSFPYFSASLYIHLHCLLFCRYSNLTHHCVFLTFQKSYFVVPDNIFIFYINVVFTPLTPRLRPSWSVGISFFALGGVGLLLPSVRTCKRRRLGS